jgi:hypothetical protein
MLAYRYTWKSTYDIKPGDVARWASEPMGPLLVVIGINIAEKIDTKVCTVTYLYCGKVYNALYHHYASWATIK